MCSSGAIRRMCFDTQWGSNDEKEVQAFGFEEKEVCPTCVLRFTVGLSGISNRSRSMSQWRCGRSVSKKKRRVDECGSIHSGDVRHIEETCPTYVHVSQKR